MLRILTLVFIVTAATLCAQPKWSLQQCIAYAKEHNIGLKQSAITNQINQNNKDQSTAGALPSLNAGANHVYNFGQTIDRYTNTFANSRVLSQNFFMSSSWVVWGGGSQYNNIKASEYTYLSGVEQTHQMENDLSLNVANAYIGVIFSEELLKIAQNQFEVTKQQLEQTLKMVNAGASAKSVEYDIRAQLANEELNVTTADNNFQISMLTLRQLMNIDSTRFDVQRPDIEPAESQLMQTNVENVYLTSIKTMPSVRSSEYKVKSAERVLAQNRGRISPTLTFNASMGTGYSGLAKDILGAGISGYQPMGATESGELVYVPTYTYVTRPTPFNHQFTHNFNKSVGLTLSVPIFNGLQTHTAVKNAKLNAYNVKLSQDLLKQNLYKDIAQAYANARASFNKYKASQASVDAATEAFRYAQIKLNSGAISAFDFTASKNRLFAAESNLLQAKYDYIFKLKVLDFYQGKPLDL